MKVAPDSLDFKRLEFGFKNPFRGNSLYIFESAIVHCSRWTGDVAAFMLNMNFPLCLYGSCTTFQWHMKKKILAIDKKNFCKFETEFLGDWTIYSNSERSEKFFKKNNFLLVTGGFYIQIIWTIKVPIRKEPVWKHILSFKVRNKALFKYACLKKPKLHMKPNREFETIWNNLETIWKDLLLLVTFNCI